MAAGSFVTYTHCSVRYKITSGVNRRVHADASCVCADPSAFARTREFYFLFFLKKIRVRADAGPVRMDKDKKIK
jgi:hypothetical protein